MTTMKKEFCEQHKGFPEKLEECFDCVFSEGWNKGQENLKKEISKMIKENTLQNRYRDGETAFDIVRDIETI